MRRRHALGLLSGSLITSLSGCITGGQTFDTYRYERDAPVDGPVAIPWRTQAFDAQRSGYNPTGRLPLEPTVELFASARDPIAVQPAFIDGVAYFGGKQVDEENVTDSDQVGLKASDSGQDQWFLPIDTAIASPTVIGSAIFVTNGGMTRALDRRDGSLCWEYHRGSGYPTASPTAVGEMVYVTGERVFALTATTGEVQWATRRPETRFSGTAADEAGVYGTAGGQGRGAVYGFDPQTGRERWQKRTDSEVLVPPVLGELVFAVEAAGRLLALEGADGSEVWSWDLAGRSDAMPAVADGTVYAVATSGSTLHAIDATTGDPQWKSEFDARRVVSPTVTGDSVYVPTAVQNGGMIYEFVAETGTLRREYELPGPPVTSLIVGGGVGLIGIDSQSSGTQFHRLSSTQDGPR